MVIGGGGEPGGTTGGSLSWNAQLVRYPIDAPDRRGDGVGAVPLPIVGHRTAQGDLAVSYLHRDVTGVDVVVEQQALGHVLENPLVGAPMALGPPSGKGLRPRPRARPLRALPAMLV